MKEFFHSRLERFLKCFMIIAVIPVATHAFSEIVHCFEESCYFTDNSLKTWEEAETNCKNESGNLLQILDQFEQTFIENSLLKAPNTYWIGLNDRRRDGLYSWLNMDKLTFQKWDINQPVIGVDKLDGQNSDELCVTIKSDPLSGFWIVTNCSEYHFSICEVSQKLLGGLMKNTSKPAPCAKDWSQYDDFCYKTDYSLSLSWPDALEFCHNLGGDLASIHSSEQQEFIDQEFGGHEVWIGLNKINTSEGHHVWSDKSVVIYTKWKSGEPNDYHHLEDCVLLENIGLDQRVWDDRNCQMKNNFICKIHIGITPNKEKAVDSSKSLVPCQNDKDWKFFGDSCYNITYETLSWQQARKACRKDNSELVSINSRDELEFVFKLVHFSSNSNIWIGLNKLLSSEYKWSDGKPVIFKNWASGEPNNAFFGENCAAIVEKSGTWLDINCASQTAFVCKKVISNPQPLPPIETFSGSCPNGWADADDRCYKIYSQPNLRKNWEDAYNYCRSLGEYYNLASIPDAINQDYLITMLKDCQTPLWIGKIHLQSDDSWNYWTDNSDGSFINWNYGQPRVTYQTYGPYFDRMGKYSEWNLLKDKDEDEQEGNCTLMDNAGFVAGKWSSHNCSDKLGYVCEKIKGPFPTKIEINEPVSTSITCPSDYKAYEKSCYKLIKDLKSWDSAEAECNKESAKLVSIDNVYDNAYVQWMARKANVTVWIGLSNKKNKNIYEWSTGWPLVFNKWNNKLAYVPLDKTYCAVIEIDEYTSGWNVSDCNEVRAFICKQSVETTPTLHAKDTGKCPEDDTDWVDAGENCFLIKPSERHIREILWAKALSICKFNGYQLASFSGESEYNFIKDLVKSLSGKYLWIGLYKTLNSDFFWSDNSKVTFTAWGPEYPMNVSRRPFYNENRDCVVIDVHGTWRNIACEHDAGYICKYSKTATTTPSVIQETTSINQEMVTTVSSIEITTSHPILNTQASEAAQMRQSDAGLSTGAIFAICLCVLIGLLMLGFSVLAYKKRSKLPNFMDNPRGFLHTLCYASDDEISELPENMEQPK